jgi:hypothetical protein
MYVTLFADSLKCKNMQLRSHYCFQIMEQVSGEVVQKELYQNGRE